MKYILHTFSVEYKTESFGEEKHPLSFLLDRKCIQDQLISRCLLVKQLKLCTSWLVIFLILLHRYMQGSKHTHTHTHTHTYIYIYIYIYKHHFKTNYIPHTFAQIHTCKEVNTHTNI